ncbi:MAG: BrnT family toxin [Planctomycetes bacterium]|nr:BrnT family toxin [Planctomycetota bacterium]
MYIDDFIWLPDIADKIALKHGLSQDEVEPGEDVYAALGQTDAGRYVAVFFIHKPGHLALVVSARDMDRKERRRYERG